MDSKVVCLTILFIPATNLDDKKTIFDNQATKLVMVKYLFISGKYGTYFP
jgi:hypothetical protein